MWSATHWPSIWWSWHYWTTTWFTTIRPRLPLPLFVSPSSFWRVCSGWETLLVWGRFFFFFSLHLFMLLQLVLVFSLPHSNTTLRIVRTSWGPSCSTWLKMWWRWMRGRQSSWWVLASENWTWRHVRLRQNCSDLTPFVFYCRLWRTSTLTRSCWRWAASLSSSQVWWRTWLPLCSAAPEPYVDISGLTLLHFKMDLVDSFSLLLSLFFFKQSFLYFWFKVLSPPSLFIILCWIKCFKEIKRWA